MMQKVDASEITTGLWVGSAPPVGRTLARVGFSVLALCAKEHQPSYDSFPGVVVVRASLVDDGTPLSRTQLEEALWLSGHLAAACRRGKGVLVTCMQGRNRSGFIAALMFARMTGCDGRTAMHAVQSRRASPFGPALTNREFKKALEAIPAAHHRGLVTSRAVRASGLRR
jgi:hypothetical protein